MYYVYIMRIAYLMLMGEADTMLRWPTVLPVAVLLKLPLPLLLVVQETQHHGGDFNALDGKVLYVN
jgi:hypothetical protein